MAIQERPLNPSLVRVIPSARSSTPTTSSIITIIYSGRWAALTTISFHRLLGLEDLHMDLEQHLGEWVRGAGKMFNYHYQQHPPTPSCFTLRVFHVFSFVFSLSTQNVAWFLGHIHSTFIRHSKRRKFRIRLLSTISTWRSKKLTAVVLKRWKFRDA